MKKISFQDWLIKHIGDNPNINFGSLYRDSCYQYSREKDDIFSILKNLVNEEIITETKKDHNTYYNLGKQLHRDKLLKNLGI